MPRDTHLEPVPLIIEDLCDPVREARITFCKDLENGRWIQTTGTLYRKWGKRGMVCALGAALDFCGADLAVYEGFPSIGELRPLGITYEEMRTCIEMNDRLNMTFPEIATAFRGHWGLPAA